MALGNYNNNKRSSSSELTVYSNLKLSNNQSEVDKTSLSFTLWNNMLGIQLAPIVTDNNGNISYDRESAITIWLSVTKAYMLANEIERFVSGEATNVGVHTRAGIINITNGAEYGVSNPCITIRKLNEDGQVISSWRYETKTDYYYSIDNFEEHNRAEPSWEKHADFNMMELDLIRIQCNEYIKSMTMANAYATGQITNRQNKYLDYKVTKIAEASGITFDNDRNSGYRNMSSFFDTHSNNLATKDTEDNDDFE